MLEEGGGIGRASHKIAEERFGGSGVPAREDFFAKFASGFFVQNSLVQKAREAVGFEHFRPLVGIVTRRVAGGFGKQTVQGGFAEKELSGK